MLDFLDILGLTVMILLRFGIPVAVLAVAAHFLKRLDARWEAEARDSAEAAKTAEQPTATERPVAPVRPASRRAPAPGPLPTFIPPPPAKPVYQQQPGLTLGAAQPCWDSKGCSEEKKATCAAPAHPDVPCWQARLDAEGKIPDGCVECDVFQRYPLM